MVKPTYKCPVCCEMVYKKSTKCVSMQYYEREENAWIKRSIRSQSVCRCSYCTKVMWNRLCDDKSLEHMKFSDEIIARSKSECNK